MYHLPCNLVDISTNSKEAAMDITKREITKIAREVGKFTVRTLRVDGIGSSEFDVIHAIRKNPGITQAEVSRITGQDKAAVARQTANLEAKGFLERRDNETDKRKKALYATEKAETLKISKVHVETVFYEWLTSSLSDNDKAEFARILNMVYEKCKAESKADFKTVEALTKEV
jgi:Transcriptional regulators